jgi:hypothetical protein
MKITWHTNSFKFWMILLFVNYWICVPCLAAPSPNRLTPQEMADGWLLLWDGESFFGWERKGVQPEWQIDNGTLLCDKGDDSWMATSAEFADFILKLEYRNPADGNSGIFLRAAQKGNPAQTGYETQICDMHRNYPTGSLLNIKKARKTLLDPEAWHTMEMTADADHITIRLDGSRILDTHDSTFRTGHIGLQYNKGKRIEFRNIKIKPLGWKPVFNGTDLGGWNSMIPSGGPPSSVWSVKSGMIHAEKGPGTLESMNEYRDFLLQLEIRTNPLSPDQHPSGGIFLRGDPGEIFSGYSVQIRNEFIGNDRTQPVDFGTGGIYQHQAARKIIARDGDFFYGTICARGHHLAVWINGYQVTDFTDINPEGLDVSKNQTRIQAGKISLRIGDSLANLDFRNLRIVEFPAPVLPQP